MSHFRRLHRVIIPLLLMGAVTSTTTYGREAHCEGMAVTVPDHWKRSEVDAALDLPAGVRVLGVWSSPHADKPESLVVAAIPGGIQGLPSGKSVVLKARDPLHGRIEQRIYASAEHRAILLCYTTQAGEGHEQRFDSLLASLRSTESSSGAALTRSLSLSLLVCCAGISLVLVRLIQRHTWIPSPH